MAGLQINTFSVVYCRQQIAFPPPPPGPPLSTEAIMLVIKSTQVTEAVIPPLTLNNISKIPHLLSMLGALKCIMTRGGALSKAAGDAIINKTILVNIFGSTELGMLRSLEVDQKDRAYLRPSINTGVEYRHVDGILCGRIYVFIE